MIDLIPAVDLLEGKCVRLAQGDYERVTVFHEDPMVPLQQYLDAGIRRIHIVDLNAARGVQDAANDAALQKMVAAAPATVQVGGGVRQVADVLRLRDLGVWRVVVGTTAMRNPKLVRQWASDWPQGIVAALDAREGRVMLQGWQEAGAPVTEVAEQYCGSDVAAILYTNIARDGMLTGPDVPGTLAVAKAAGIPAIVSGGISSRQDVEDIIQGSDRNNVSGIIIGRAYYDGKITLAELAQLQEMADAN